MFADEIANLSTFLSLNEHFIPDIITLLVYVCLLIPMLKSSLTGLTVVGLMATTMGILEILGISSEHFNIITILAGAF